MRFAFFYHSIASDWNHGNAHFLRGVARDLLRRGHEVRVYEPKDGWSRTNLIAGHGTAPIGAFEALFPEIVRHEYALATLDLDAALDGVDVVLVHEWNEPELVAALGKRRKRGGRFLLFFHDTHHRSVTAPEDMAAFDLDGYDGVLAFGEVIREIYVRHGWARSAWTWHEAADISLFRPMPREKRGDLVWIGNWGDGERTAELRDFLLSPIERLRLRAEIYGVRYPDDAIAAIAGAGATYRGWLPNYAVPEAFAQFRVTIHVPRRPYVEALPGIPTIRLFEALACGIPLICAPWRDSEGLFTPGSDFLLVDSGEDMTRALRDLLNDDVRAAALARQGRETILRRHTCTHRVDELLAICAALREPAVQANEQLLVEET
jgi:spore maturation protein CgeB